MERKRLNDYHQLLHKCDTPLTKKSHKIDKHRDNLYDLYWLRFMEDGEINEFLTCSDLHYIEAAFYQRPYPFKKHKF